MSAVEATNISFKFSRTIRTHLVERDSDLISDNASADETSLKNGGHYSDEGPSTAPKELLVIPVVRGKSKYFTGKTATTEQVTEITSTVERSAEDIAAEKALLADAEKLKKSAVIEETIESSLLINVDEEIVNDEETGELPNYDAIPLEAFGKAMMRGMGWKDDQRFGSMPKLTSVRPAGLGLGAQLQKQPVTANGDSGQKNGKDAEKLELKLGAYVKCTEEKRSKNCYGKVVGWDEDTGSAMVQLAIGKEIVRVNQLFMNVISAEEYERRATCINQEAFEEFKQKEADLKKASAVAEAASGKSVRTNDKSSEHGNRRRSRSRSRSPPRQRVRRWLRPDLRVRIIDKNYRRGKFYESKVTVLDVAGSGICSCLTGDRKTVLNDVLEEMLETVIPRGNDAVVQIIRGKFNGEIGRILERDTSRCTAVVRLSDVAKNFSYDDICEYVGEMPEF